MTVLVNLSRSLCLISLSTWTSLHLISLSLVLAPAAGSDAQCGRLGVGGGCGCGLPGSTVLSPHMDFGARGWGTARLPHRIAGAVGGWRQCHSSWESGPRGLL